MQSVVSDALAEFGGNLKSAVPQLIKTVKTGERSAEVSAAYALWRIQGKDDPAIAEIVIGALRKAVASDDYTTSSSAASHSAKLGRPQRARSLS